MEVKRNQIHQAASRYRQLLLQPLRHSLFISENASVFSFSFLFFFPVFPAIECSGSGALRKMKGCHAGKTCF